MSNQLAMVVLVRGSAADGGVCRTGCLTPENEMRSLESIVWCWLGAGTSRSRLYLTSHVAVSNAAKERQDDRGDS